ncbi:fungal-specific transcription factor domain-containing protein [Pisolithus orientalis]|uniref:fungal-specific transcription factor domain-containing protein n=1 Tax=Pisolithus orientalis TaxID=936130 RepID=UPI0022252D29|nr:fungal-specific transcription factor domain-containing protein [Pisolithus orientalis]KAI6001034.1 fungal-specific transcription factor domain-containing protein [Pisolithus orientalis]
MPVSLCSPAAMDTHILNDPSKKRRKGATRLSCAECRRLKLRCDRQIPCGSCVKRGCGAICPDGSLTTGQGNRFVLASTTELHDKISELCNRVRQLEDALRISHSMVSGDRHPLLSEELLQIKAPLQREPPSLRNVSKNEVKREDQNSEVVDAFGSLSINAAGGANYHGSIANSWYFLQNEVSDGPGSDSDRLNVLKSLLSPMILGRSGAFPIVPSSQHPPVAESEDLRQIFWNLPEASKAQVLIQSYFRLGTWIYNPISEQDFNEEIYHIFYERNAHPAADDPLVSHKLSVMFIVLAIGTFMNTQIPAYSIDAEKYYHLARAALFQRSLLDNPTVSAVQALFLMTFYLFLSDRHGSSSGSRWVMMGTTIKIAQSIGLHRDPSKWLTDAREILRRRTLFWELYTYDSWQCITLGRPPSFNLAHIDCKLPSAGDDDDSFHTWKHRFTSECMSVIHDQAFGAKTPSYDTVLHLDRKLRAFPVPPNLQVVGFGGSANSTEPRHQDSVLVILQRHIVLAIREMNLLSLHRSFFARALTDHPKDPLGSSYGTSVIAAYRSAGSLVALMRNLHTQIKEPSERIWFLWTHMFSCAIVLGSVVTRCPSMSLAPSALVQLDSACELFSKTAHGFRAQPVLDIMMTLREKAHHSLEEYRSGKVPPITRQLSSQSEPRSPFNENDELVLCGKTRLVDKKDSVTPSPPMLPSAVLDHSPTSFNPVVPLPLATSGGNQVHPFLVDYLRSFSNAPNNQYHGNGQMNGNVSYGMNSPSQEHPFPQESLLASSTPPSYTGGEYDDCQMAVQPMELVSGQFPSYFPVYDYSYGGGNSVNGYSQRNGSGSHVNGAGVQVPGRGISPEGNMMLNAWQEFVDSSVSSNVTFGN